MAEEEALRERTVGPTLVVGRADVLDHVVDLVREHASLYRGAAAGSARAFSGRGAPHVLPTPFGDWVVRRYRRGGVVARVVEDRYLRVGTPRPLAELRVSDEARARGVPTPRVVAATVETRGAAWSGDLAADLVADAKDLAAVLFAADSLRKDPGGDDGASRHGRGEDPEGQASRERAVAPAAGTAGAAMRAAGRLMRLIHERGLVHPDLNLKNILIQNREDGGLEGWVIDLDRARLVDGPVPPRHRRRMLRRFHRSLRKWERARARIVAPSARAAFEAGYSEAPAADASGGTAPDRAPR